MPHLDDNRPYHDGLHHCDHCIRECTSPPSQAKSDIGIFLIFLASTYISLFHLCARYRPIYSRAFGPSAVSELVDLSFDLWDDLFPAASGPGRQPPRGSYDASRYGRGRVRSMFSRKIPNKSEDDKSFPDVAREFDTWWTELRLHLDTTEYIYKLLALYKRLELLVCVIYAFMFNGCDASCDIA
ncbi:hypothetical protein An03g02450 [Aspergillus niger]|uniref:Uncharacterized protein n=2 Tax=Aspergillus niger TaxID=5061 RepID=A2QGA2_ASPNC|nr:hypothetical protein An03g02450 [Aspergillus niger]CAK38212.1 hypothetical protein An03g02450 [Aspergillus niger]